MRFISLPSVVELRQAFIYDPFPGYMTRIDGNVGSWNAEGYRIFYFKGRPWRASRLIWKIMTGVDPGEMEVDHKDGNVKNDSWENLRLGTRSQQRMNTARARNNGTGVKGVYERKDGKFVAYITAAVRLEAERAQHGEYSSHGR